VAWTARSLPPRPSVPVLAGILLEVDGNQLSVSGFDYEVSARCGPMTLSLCRHVDNSTAVHRHRPISTPRPRSARRSSPCRVGNERLSTGTG
jgi:hypothetical protein